MSSTIWRGPGLIGSQRPRVWSAPSAPTSAGDEAVRLARVAGLELLPWQEFVVEHAMRQGSDERWAAFEVLLLVPRQNGKGTVLEVVELYALFVLGLNVYHTAHLMKTSRKAFTRLMTLIDRTPQLRRRVAGVRKTAEELAVTLSNGASATFMARGQRAGRGLDDCDVLILDEALFLEARTVEAILPTMSTRPNPQVWYTSSAGVASSSLLRSLRARIHAQDPGLAGFEWSVEAPTANRPLDPLDIEAMAQSNPSLGSLISVDYVRGEVRALMAAGSAAGVARERFGVFDEDPESLKRLISRTSWDLRGDAQGRPDGPVAFGVAHSADDLPEWSAIVAATRDDESGEVAVQVVEYRPGSAWLPGRLAELVEVHDPVATVLDPAGPAGFLVEAIEDDDEDGPDGAAVELVKPKVRETAHAAQQFVGGVVGDAPWVRHYGQPELDTAVGGAGKKPHGDSFTLQRRGDVDICPLEGAVLAAWGVSVFGPALYDIRESVH
jgi:hypothetical protein